MRGYEESCLSFFAVCNSTVDSRFENTSCFALGSRLID